MRVLAIGGPEFGRQAEAAMVEAGVIVNISELRGPYRVAVIRRRAEHVQSLERRAV